MLTACGIETVCLPINLVADLAQVATVLTACGIETCHMYHKTTHGCELQQCLPLAVLKLNILIRRLTDVFNGCNSAYRLRY